MKLSLFMLLFSFSVHADFYMEWENNGNKITKTFIKDAKSRVENGSQIVITDMSSGLSYQINNKSKTMKKMDINKMRQQMGSFMKDIKRVPTGQKRTVNGKECEVIKLEMGAMGSLVKSESCEVHYSKLGISKKVYEKMFSVAEKYMPEMNTIMNKAKGYFAIETVSSTSFGGGKQRMVLQKIEEKSFSDSLFEIPKGYKVTEMKTPGGNKAAPNPKQMKDAMEKMKEMMKNMPPEQRKKLEEMMQQGQ